MNEIALFLNYDKLGGAEKSGLEQREIYGAQRVDLFAPKINETSEIDDAKHFSMPKGFYKASRSSSNNYILIFLSYVFWLLFAKKVKINNYEKLWFNGLKVFLLHFPLIIFSRFRNPIFFHQRDYLVDNKLIHLIFRTLKSYDIRIISNSMSVAKDFNQKYGKYGFKIQTSYNPFLCKSSEKKVKTFKIATASMLTPWKGIHMIVLFTRLYEKELLELGVREVSIYGDSIYKTKEEISNYKKEILSLGEQTSLIKFRGKVNAEDIYENCDILLHSSIKAEPFGRVILEAFVSRVLVLSTGLGGAREVIPWADSLFRPNDFEGLLAMISRYLLDSEALDKKLDLQALRADKINQKAALSIVKILSCEDA